MNWIKSALGYGKGDLASGESPYDRHINFKANGELYVPAPNKEGKACKYPSSALNIRFNDCDIMFDIGEDLDSHAVKIANLLYDPEQDNEEAVIIPLTPELKFAGYIGRNMDDEEFRGYSFYAGSKHYLFQFPPGKDQKADMLELLTTELIFEASTHQPFASASKKQLREFCPYFSRG